MKKKKRKAAVRSGNHSVKKQSEIKAEKNDNRLLLLFICCLALVFTGIYLSNVLSDDSKTDVYSFSKNCDGGSGTKNNPLIISSAEQLMLLSKEVNAGNSFQDVYIRQAADIDLDGVDFIPIGTFISGNCFCGIYDGNGHVISNIRLDAGNSEEGNVGLFGVLAGRVYNLGIDNCSISGKYVGAIASGSAGNRPAIVNCWSSGRLSGMRTGGIADDFEGDIINCFSVCELDSQYDANLRSYSGMNYSTIKNSYILESNIDSPWITVDDAVLTDDEFMRNDMCSELNKWVDFYSSINPVKLCKWENTDYGHPVLVSA